MLKIANIKMKNQIVLAPMVGICNPAFRLIAKEFGCGLVCAEMVSGKALVHGNERTRKMLYVDDREKPLSLQIFGGDRKSLVEAAKIVDKDSNADIIDINMGCPVPKVTKCDAGARWLLNPDKVYEMVSAVVEAVSKPVTVKMRIGWDHDHIYVVENAQAVERAGGQAVSVHGRTREQLYTGRADWGYISRVKKAISIPVIGNGDVFSPEDAKRMLNETDCDGVMIGRGALGNPWMLFRTVQYLTNGKLLPDPSAEEKIRVAIVHMDRLITLKGEQVAVKEMRKHLAWYLKGLPSVARVKDAIMEKVRRDEVVYVLNNYVYQMNEEQVAVPIAD